MYAVVERAHREENKGCTYISTEREKEGETSGDGAAEETKA